MATETVSPEGTTCDTTAAPPDQVAARLRAAGSLLSSLSWDLLTARQLAFDAACDDAEAADAKLSALAVLLGHCGLLACRGSAALGVSGAVSEPDTWLLGSPALRVAMTTLEAPTGSAAEDGAHVPSASFEPRGMTIGTTMPSAFDSAGLASACIEGDAQ